MDFAAEDLRETIGLALERGAGLLTVGERVVLDAALSLPDAELGVFARLAGRVSPFQRAEAAGVARGALQDAGLIDGLVPWSVRADQSTVAELQAGARTLGLPVGGRRDALIARLRGRVGWSSTAWIRVRHRGLLLRCARWATLRVHPDPAERVVERIGQVAWPTYPCTPGPGLFPTRAALRAWEALADAPADTPPEVLLAGLRSGAAAGPARLDLTRAVARAICELAQPLERADGARARALYDGVADVDPRRAVRAGLRAARSEELDGDPRAAFARLQALRPLARGPERFALQRAGRRLGRGIRAGWAPERPLAPIRERSVALEPAGTNGARPLWGRGVPVERAVIDALGEVGRQAVHGEGGTWTTLFALIFAEAYFLPIPGQLPVPRLSGPLDLGTPAFAARRQDAVRDALTDVRAGRASARVRASHARFAGRRLAGLRWSDDPSADLDAHLTLVDAVGPALLDAVLTPLLTHGWRAASGLPDLLVHPGPAVVFERAVASRLDGGVRLVEVKGPGDTLSDPQRWWIEHLAPVAPVEVWNVRPG